MRIKLNRESVLVTISAFILLIGLFYYGHQILVEPLAEEADSVRVDFETQQSLMEEYPVNEELPAEYESEHSKTESFLPLNVQANQALITLETLASKAGISVLSLSRVAEEELLEESENFAKATYTTQLAASSPANLRQLVDLLMEEERVWNILSFSYSKSGEKNYDGTIDFELYYRIENRS